MLSYEAAKEQYLVFRDCEIQFPGSKLLQRGFSHVFVIERQALGWICYDASVSDLHCSTLPASWDDDVIGVFARDNPTSTILKLNTRRAPPAWGPRGGLMTCVGVVQYIIGVYWPFILTPYQLYSRLLKDYTNHIDVEKYIWVAAEQEERQSQQQRHQEQKLQH